MTTRVIYYHILCILSTIN